MSEPILSVRNLAVSFRAGVSSRHRAVDGVSFSIHPRQTLGIVGESGCGKSVTAMTMLRLVPTSRIDAGSALFASKSGLVDLLTLDDSALRRVRGGEIAMIFQEPMSSLNPVFSVGEQIVEAVRLHQGAAAHRAREIAVHAMASVGIPEPERRFRQYPHQFSGGMRQRVMIAMALSCRPSLLIADEPTTALDVTIQAQILDMLRDLKRTRDLSVLLITHDMGVVAENADVVCVMFAGRVVEYAPVVTLFERPLHPYTRGLLACIPRLGQRRDRLLTIREVIDNPEEFTRLSFGDVPVRPWWPGHSAPANLRPLPGVAGDCALIEIEPDHWVGLWRTEALPASPRPPDLAHRREPASAAG